MTCYADGAIGRALEGADAMVVGADAVGPDWFLNKTGTRMLAALAATEGVPVYVVASRDKFVGRAIASRLAIPQKPPAEVWDNAPAGVEVRNLYFEPTPLDLVTSVITDVGVLGSGTIPDVCESAEDDALRAALADLGL